jgi:hypothetical protein
MDPLHTLRPMKLVEHADGLMQYAQVLYEKHRPIMRPDDRMLAEDRITRYLLSTPPSPRLGIGL